MPNQIVHLTQEEIQRTKKIAEKVIERIVEKLNHNDGPPQGHRYVDHLAKALDAVTSGYCVIGGVCHDGFTASSCSPVGSYGGDGSHCA